MYSCEYGRGQLATKFIEAVTNRHIHNAVLLDYNATTGVLQVQYDGRFKNASFELVDVTCTNTN